MIRHDLSHYFAVAMAERGWDEKRMARAIGVSPRQVRRMTAGDTYRTDTMERALHQLGLRVTVDVVDDR